MIRPSRNLPRALALAVAILALSGLVAAAPAGAQTAGGTGGQDPTKANPTGPTLAQPPAQAAPDNGTDRGIIRPPTTVDPGIHQAAPVPQAGTMPVIPPPGTPGGNPNVVPK